MWEGHGGRGVSSLKKQMGNHPNLQSQGHLAILLGHWLTEELPSPSRRSRHQTRVAVPELQRIYNLKKKSMGKRSGDGIMMFLNHDEGVESALHYYPRGWGGRTQGKTGGSPVASL